MASVEQYLTVLAGAQSAQNAEAQRLAAQMQIEVRLPLDRSASGHIVTRSIRVAATAPFRPPPSRVDRSIPSFSHLFRCARERKLALLVPLPVCVSVFLSSRVQVLPRDAPLPNLPNANRRGYVFSLYLTHATLFNA
jgi:hypothetical protein